MHDEASIIEASKNAPRAGMSRGAQTAWIVATMIGMGLAALMIWNAQDHPNDPYNTCRNILGFHDQECVDSVDYYRSQGFR